MVGGREGWRKDGKKVEREGRHVYMVVRMIVGKNEGKGESKVWMTGKREQQRMRRKV